MNIFRRKKNILTYGTFDLYHKGHIRIIDRAAKYTKGGKLFVGVSSDNWNKLKGKQAIQKQSDRLELVKKNSNVHLAFYEDHNKAEEQWLDDYKKYDIDLIIMGDDHKGKLDYLREKGMKIKYLPRTKGISTTKLKKLTGHKSMQGKEDNSTTH